MKAIQTLNERYKNDDAMMQESLKPITRSKPKPTQTVRYDSTLMDNLELDDDDGKSKKSAKEDFIIIDESELKRNNSLFDKWRLTKKGQEDEENAFLNLGKGSSTTAQREADFDEYDPDLPPKKITNLNLKEKLANQIAILAEEKKFNNPRKPMIVFDTLNFEPVENPKGFTAEMPPDDP
jgi:hypothetical protein